MKDIVANLIGEEIYRMDCLEDKLYSVARIIDRRLNEDPRGILYECEVANALGDVLKTKKGSLSETDRLYLSKPAKNNNYPKFGIKFKSIREAILYTLDNEKNPIDIHFNIGKNTKKIQQLSPRIILYKDDEKLRRYIRSKLDPIPKLTYTFFAPDEVLNK